MSSSRLYLALALWCCFYLSSSTICPQCKVIQDCSSNFLGSYNLKEENSIYCPEAEGFTGCLYEKSDSLRKFCFKSGPLEQCSSYNQNNCGTTQAPSNVIQSTADSDPDPKPAESGDDDNSTELVIDDDPKNEDLLNNKVYQITSTTTKTATTTTGCLDNFPNLSSMSDTEVAGLCCDESDCQENAGCFLDELSNTFKTYCQCYLGYSLDNSTSSLPKTGDCLDMRAQDCSDPTVCYENSEYTLCPYCYVARKIGLKETIIGHYDFGEGSFSHNDPMTFTGSSSGCADETTEVFWYCWYDTMDQVVDLNQAFVLVEEYEVCEHLAYIYTPLACPFALDA